MDRLKQEKMIDEANYILKVGHSCKTLQQLDVAFTMFRQWRERWGDKSEFYNYQVQERFAKILGLFLKNRKFLLNKHF